MDLEEPWDSPSGIVGSSVRRRPLVYAHCVGDDRTWQGGRAVAGEGDHIPATFDTLSRAMVEEFRFVSAIYSVGSLRL